MSLFINAHFQVDVLYFYKSWLIIQFMQTKHSHHSYLYCILIYSAVFDRFIYNSELIHINL